MRNIPPRIPPANVRYTETPARKPNKFLDRFAAREAAFREREAREEAANIAVLDSWGGKHGWCYFLGCEEGIVKIGYSRKLNARISAIQSQSLYKLTLLAVAGGGREREGIYHNRFKAHALGGEWFTRCPEIEAEIAHLTSITQVPA